MWPMLAGLAPLLGEEVPGFFQTRSGERSAWQVTPSAKCAAKPFADRVAVLIGPRTASSGEAVAVAFRGRAATRFFGQPTAGLSTGNQDIALPDGAKLMLTTSVYVDRHGQTYPDGIAPDSLHESDEATLAAARTWLASDGVPENHACR